MNNNNPENGLNPQFFAATIFSKITYKIKFSSKKTNRFLLSTDLLKDSVKKDLFLITAIRLEKLYSELLTSRKPFSFDLMKSKGQVIFLLLIKLICEDFLTQQYGYKVSVNLKDLKKSLQTKNLLQDTEILFQLPFYALADPSSPTFRLIYYPIYSSASATFIEALIDNLIVEISNCVAYFIVISFSSIYSFRQTLYKSQFLSLRNFERFKNNLSWQARINTYIKRPLSLYNNRYNLYVLRTSGLYCRTIYANRSKEISHLSKLSLVTIVFIEIRDFVGSRLDETLYTSIKVIRFTLTSVLGQIIGLIWRGVIEGLKK